MRRILILLAAALALGACGKDKTTQELENLAPVAQATASILNRGGQTLEEIAKAASPGEAPKARAILAQTLEAGRLHIKGFAPRTPEGKDMQNELLICVQPNPEAEPQAETSGPELHALAMEAGTAGSCVERVGQTIARMATHPDAVLAWRIQHLHPLAARPTPQSAP